MIPSALVLFLLQVPAPAAVQGAPAHLDAPMAEVTVYPESAVVRRRAQVQGPGSYAVEGLPRGLDPEALRVRGVGVEVVRAELRERVRAAAPDARVEGLRADLAGVERELEDVAGQRDVLKRVQEHLTRLLAPDPGPLLALASSGAAERPSVAAWGEDLAYLERRMTAVREQDRAQAAAARALERRRDALQLELGGLEGGAGVAVYDLLLDVYGPAGPAALEVDYAVPNAGWSPLYDLRAARDLAQVELVYRARVWQHTGEDWRDVDLILSTAEPRRGAQGPDPQERWVGLNDPRAPSGSVAARRGRDAPSEQAGRKADKPTAPPFASVEDQGLSVRYRLPERETVEARAGAVSTVLVGRAQLKIEPERLCVPAQDPGVWLSAKARNTSEFVLFRGSAGIYFGADFIGHAELPGVQRNEEFTLPLGLDPALTAERVLLSDQSSEPGMFGSKRTQETAWRIELKNAGAITARPDGAVEVRVQESLPKASDDRIEVELDKAKPEPAGGERWKKLREERGVLTWHLIVPRGGSAAIELATSIAYPAEDQLLRRIER